jgi:hypothetical protein
VSGWRRPWNASQRHAASYSALGKTGGTSRALQSRDSSDPSFQKARTPSGPTIVVDRLPVAPIAAGDFDGSPFSTGAPGSRPCHAPGLVLHAGTCAFGEPESAPSMYSISKPYPTFVDDPELPFERLGFEQGHDPLERG